MTIFQKIAASSFAAVRATLRRRLLNLTIHEAIICDQKLDVEGRERALSDARQLFHEMFGLATEFFRPGTGGAAPRGRACKIASQAW